MEIYQLLLIAAIAMGGSFIQSVTGFGFGIFAMMFLPYIFSLFTEANMLSSILGALTSIFVLITMYKYVNWKNVVFPLIGSFAGTFIAVTFIKTQSNSTLKLLLGAVLFLLRYESICVSCFLYVVSSFSFTHEPAQRHMMTAKIALLYILFILLF